MATYAQCPSGLSQLNTSWLTVTVEPNRGSTYNPDTHQFTTDTTKYSATAKVSEVVEQVLIRAGYTDAQFRFGMQGEGENLLHHGVMWSAGRLRNGQFEGLGIPIHFHNLEPDTKYAVELHVENANLQSARPQIRKCFQTPAPQP